MSVFWDSEVTEQGVRVEVDVGMIDGMIALGRNEDDWEPEWHPAEAGGSDDSQDTEEAASYRSLVGEGRTSGEKRSWVETSAGEGRLGTISSMA
jgi:hypothetical protein